MRKLGTVGYWLAVAVVVIAVDSVAHGLLWQVMVFIGLLVLALVAMTALELRKRRTRAHSDY